MTFKLKAQRPKLRENDVERGITDLLALSGWTVLRQHSGLMKLPYKRRTKGGKENDAFMRVGEVGIPDWLALHARLVPGQIFIEAKRPGGRPSPEQSQKIRELQLGGFLAGWFDSIESFRDFYRRVFEQHPMMRTEPIACPKCRSERQNPVPNPPGAWLCLGCRRYWGGEEF